MKMLCILFILITGQLEASTLKVHDIVAPDHFDSNYLIFLSNGEILELSSDKADVLEELYWAKDTNSVIDIEILKSSKKSLNQRSIIKNVKFVSNEIVSHESFNIIDPIPTPTNGYAFTQFESTAQVNGMFNTMTKRTRSKSQCYNRAHIWIYELHQRFNSPNFGKMWIFFTRRYIKEYRYKWWFHIAPFTYAKDNDKELVLDRSYFKGAADYQTWTNFFMKNNAQCKFVEYYSQYNENQQSEYCYLIKSSMYYYQPYQIENLEKGEEERTQFKSSELVQARRNAIY